MFALLEAASAGVAHISLGADRIFVLLALGALQRRSSDSVSSACWWSLGHLTALLIAGGHMLPWWREFVEWNMYISGLLLVSFGLHINFCQHLYAQAERSQWTWEAEWGTMEICSSKQASELEDKDSTNCCGPFHSAYRGLMPYLVGNLTNFSVVACFVLGLVQGLVSPDFAFASGSAWAGQAFVSASFLYVAFSVAIAVCACMVSISAWMMTSSETRNARRHRFARGMVGIGLCCAGFLWLLLVVQLDLQISAAARDASATGSAASSIQKPGSSPVSGSLKCPLPVTIGSVNFDSAPTWEMVAKLDPWWTPELLEQHRRPPFRFTIANSHIGGCGVVADEDLPAGARVGLAGILNGPWDYSAALIHVTPWLGIAINHCSHGNAELHREGAFLFLQTRKAVMKGQEITFNYDNAADSVPIERAQPGWTC